MLRILIICWLLLPSAQSFADNDAKDGSGDGKMIFTYLYAGKPISVLTGKTSEGVRVNDVCLNTLPTCEAMKAFHGKSKIAEIKKAVPGNIAGAYCEHLHGSQLFMHEQGKTQTDDRPFCVFPDLTLLDAKALYRTHFEKSNASHP